MKKRNRGYEVEVFPTFTAYYKNKKLKKIRGIGGIININ